MAQQFTPNDHIAFRNLKDAKLFALDIGGSLTKIAYYATVPSKRVLYRSEKDIRLEFYFEKNYFEISKNSLKIIFLSLKVNFFECCRIPKTGPERRLTDHKMRTLAE